MSHVLLHQLFAFASAYALVVVLPGPNLFVVAAASQISGRLGGLKAAAGVAAGASALSILAAVAADRVSLVGTPVAGVASLAFGLLLSVIGWRVLAGSFVGRPVAGSSPRSGNASLLAGFATAIANPISAGFFASYALSAGNRPSEPAVFGTALAVFLVAAIWFGAVGLWLDCAFFRRFQLRHRRWLQTLCGAVLLALGLWKIAGLMIG